MSWDGKYGVGDVLLFSKSVDNPYRRAENILSEVYHKQRKAAFHELKVKGSLPDCVKEVWYAPAGGGAHKLLPSSVKYVGAFLEAEKLP